MPRQHAWVLPLLGTAAALAAIVFAIEIVLRLPGIPYNVRELFLNGGNVPALLFFAVAVLWMGAGARLIAELVNTARRPAVLLPVVIVIVSLVSKFLVSRAVTYESLDDILGSDNLFGLVTDHGIWGAAWRARFLWLGGDTVDFVERRVRYCALYSIPLVWNAFAFAAIAPLFGVRASRADRMAAAAVAVGWLWLSITVVLTWAATDNLTELIATSGLFGLPGPAWLMLLAGLAAAHAALLVAAPRSLAHLATAIGTTVASVPASWWLLNGGLEQRVEKYGVIFPATQFLLGPDRQHALSGQALFVRWTGVYLGAVAAVAVGAALSGAFTAGAVTSRRQAAAGVS